MQGADHAASEQPRSTWPRRRAKAHEERPSSEPCVACPDDLQGARGGRLPEQARRDRRLPGRRSDGRGARSWGGQRYEPTCLRGYRTLVQPIRFNGNFHLFHFPRLGRIIHELRPDIVHADEEPYNLATAQATYLALRNGARPLFFTWQNLNRAYPPPFSWFERYVFSRSRHAIAGNAEAVDVLRAKGYTGPSSVIPQFGIDPAVFSPARHDAAQSSDCSRSVTWVG